MRRRKFIILAGGAAAWPLAARAQQPAMPIVGFLRSTTLAPFQNLVVAFGQGLREAGFVEGRMSRSNIAMPTIKSIGCRFLWQI